MVNRKTISAKKRVALFAAHNGICHICGGKINVGEAWQVEHVIPFAMGGSDTEDNWRPAHTKCHKTKTVKDVADIAKAKRREARHIGVKVSKSPMPFGKGSKWKRKMDGSLVLREK